MTTHSPASELDARATTRTPAWNGSTAHLLDVVAAADRPQLLMACGVAIHLFAEPVQRHAELPTVHLHRATTVFTKQVAGHLDEDDPLDLIRQLATSPERLATPERASVAELLGAAWEPVRAEAAERGDAAIDGARSFGETAVLRLSATRAAGATTPWWGTPAWTSLVARAGLDQRAASQLHRAPELAPVDRLRRLLTERPIGVDDALARPA